MTHGVDHQYGGVLTCLDQTGKVITPIKQFGSRDGSVGYWESFTTPIWIMILLRGNSGFLLPKGV